MKRSGDLGRGHLDSEDSLLLDEDEGQAVEMQNPLNNLTFTTTDAQSILTANHTLNRVNINNINNPNRPHIFSDDEGSSTASSIAQLNVFGGEGVAGSAGATSTRRSTDIRCRASSECGSIFGTIHLPPLVTPTVTTPRPAPGDDEEVVEEDPHSSPTAKGDPLPSPTAAAGEGQATMMMEDVDLGSTNRIMALRGANNSSIGGDGGGSGSGNGEVATLEGCPTAEVSPETIMHGNPPSSGDELNEVSYR